MTVKECLLDYYKFPNVKAKHLSNDIDELIKNLKNTLKSHSHNPVDIIKLYEPHLRDIDRMYKMTILENPKSKSGMFIFLRNNYSIDIAIRELFNFNVSRTLLLIKYSLEKLQKLMEVEVSLLFHTYDDVYDFQIKYGIICLLFKRFSFFTPTIGDDYHLDLFTYCDDIETIYENILNTLMCNLYHINNEILNKVKPNRGAKYTVSAITKPRCAEDLLMYLEDGMTQLEKQDLLAKQYGVSRTTIKRWFKKFGIEKKSTKAIHLENIIKTQEDIKTIIFSESAGIAEYIERSKEELILIITKQTEILTASYNLINALTAELKNTLIELDTIKMDLEKLKARNKDLLNQIDHILIHTPITDEDLNLPKFYFGDLVANSSTLEL